ncbi:MAG: homoserine O-acetyltransferase [Saprospiraceae bacterium]|nr:homoserine O-acetyltransferase [Saprospiraceae bacterium]
MQIQQWKYNKPFALENGKVLPEIDIAYTTYGTPNATMDNVVWVCHALTANSDVQEWWPGMFGPGKLLDPTSSYIICANIIGSCYGSTGPTSINPATGQPYYNEFPLVTIRDMVQAHRLLANELGIQNIECIIGSSMGGHQALEWLVQEPERFRNGILIATNAEHSPWGIAFNESQRMAIEADATWGEPREDAAWNGLQAARSIGMLSYRHYNTYAKTQNDQADKTDDYLASSYQRYQGLKLAKRFNAYAYHRLSKAMDSHRIHRNRGSIQQALGKIQAKVLCIGIETDILFPPSEVEFLAANILHAEYREITSKYGHDGFLIENEQLQSLIEEACFHTAD